MRIFQWLLILIMIYPFPESYDWYGRLLTIFTGKIKLKTELNISPSFSFKRVVFILNCSYSPLGVLISLPCCCLVAKLCLTLCNPMNCRPTGSSCPWDFPAKNTGVGCHFLLQGIFPTQGSNYVSCIGRQVLSQWATIFISFLLKLMITNCINMCFSFNLCFHLYSLETEVESQCHYWENW